MPGKKESKSKKSDKGCVGYFIGGALKSGVISVFSCDEPEPNDTHDAAKETFGTYCTCRWVSSDNPSKLLKKLEESLADGGNHDCGHLYTVHANNALEELKKVSGEKRVHVRKEKSSEKKSKKGKDDDDEEEGGSGDEAGSDDEKESKSKKSSKGKKGKKSKKDDDEEEEGGSDEEEAGSDEEEAGSDDEKPSKVKAKKGKSDSKKSKGKSK